MTKLSCTGYETQTKECLNAVVNILFKLRKEVTVTNILKQLVSTSQKTICTSVKKIHLLVVLVRRPTAVWYENCMKANTFRG
jgi:hypothetical protein